MKYFLCLGVLGFGGPVALVGQMERELVDDKKWLTKDEMREGIAVCQSLLVAIGSLVVLFRCLPIARARVGSS